MKLRVLSIGAVMAVVACGGGGDDGTGPNTSQTLESISASPTTMNIVAGATGTVSVTGTDTNGQSVSGLTVTLASQNSAIAEVSGASVLGVSAGSTTITVSASKGSVTKQTTITANVTGSLPNTASVTAGITNVFSPSAVIVARNGQVTWGFGAVAHTVNFGGGQGAPQNINESANTTVSRTFTANGNFVYQCTIHAGMSGTVLVR